MSITYPLPDDLRSQIDTHPGESIAFTDEKTNRVFFVAAFDNLNRMIDDAYVRREVNKGLDSTDRRSAQPLDVNAVKREGRRRSEARSQS